MCASTVIGHLLRGWTAVLAVSAAALVLVVPLLLRSAYRAAGAHSPSRGQRLWAVLSAAPAFAVALAFALFVHKLLGLELRGGIAQTIIFLVALVGAVVLAGMLMRRDLPDGPGTLRSVIHIPAAVAVLATAGAFVAVGRLDHLARQYFATEVALRDLSADLEKHRAATGEYPLRLSQLDGPPADGLHYLPLPDGVDGGRIRAWRILDDPLGTAAAVLTCSGRVRWVSVQNLSRELEKSALAAVEHRPTRTQQPSSQPATMPAGSRTRPEPATCPSTQPTQSAH
ncbi:MAG: hypothetical protein ACP5HU_01060 [Phycisphaerae bacterium]